MNEIFCLPLLSTALSSGAVSPFAPVDVRGPVQACMLVFFRGCQGPTSGGQTMTGTLPAMSHFWP